MDNTIKQIHVQRSRHTPSGVSEGHSMPHCDGCSARGPDTFRVFSKLDFTRHIMPMREMYDNRDSCCAHTAPKRNPRIQRLHNNSANVRIHKHNESQAGPTTTEDLGHTESNEV